MVVLAPQQLDDDPRLGDPPHPVLRADWPAVRHNASIDTTRGPALVRSSANALSLPPLHSRVASAVVFE